MHKFQNKIVIIPAMIFLFSIGCESEIDSESDVSLDDVEVLGITSGALCFSDSDCASGEKCFGKTCQPDFANPIDHSMGGCKSDLDCKEIAPYFYCDYGVCEIREGRCTSNFDCPKHHECQNTYCFLSKTTPSPGPTPCGLTCGDFDFSDGPPMGSYPGFPSLP